MMIFFLIFYFFLAQWTKNMFKIKFHSIVHCCTSVLLISYFFYKNSINIITLSITKQLYILNDPFIIICAANSNGYFIADLVDILVDKNIKRRVYIFHHLVAIVGISTIYVNNNFSIFAIWCLEIGGLVHHLKYASEIYSLQFQNITNFLYFFIYSTSRFYFTLNFIPILFTYFSFSDFICVLVGISLTFQNVIWLRKNYSKTFNSK